MSATRWTAAAMVAAAISTSGWQGAALLAQGDKYTARLGWVPVGGADRVSGKGAATATLSGKSLAISGSFEGLGGPATIARLHQGVAKGARGKPVADVTVPKSTSGTFSATVALTDEQIEALKQGKLYLQLNGDKGLAPDGANLWGWFQR
jgi:hypothetical protein